MPQLNWTGTIKTLNATGRWITTKNCFVNSHSHVRMLKVSIIMWMLNVPMIWRWCAARYCLERRWIVCCIIWIIIMKTAYAIEIMQLIFDKLIFNILKWDRKSNDKSLTSWIEWIFMIWLIVFLFEHTSIKFGAIF